jgi:anti-anti-sigma factor
MLQQVDIAIVPIEFDLDVTTVAQVRRSIDTLVDAGCRRIILNMAQVSYVDSSGMGLIIGEIARMRSLGGVLSLVQVRPAVMRALKLARVVDFAPVSGGEGSRQIPALDPSTRPLSRHVMRVEPDHLAELRARTDILLSELPLSADARFDTNLAIGEAVGNAVDHTDGCDVVVAVASYPDRVVVEVSDGGCGCVQDESLNDGGEAPDPWAARGRGLRLMRLLADSVTIEPKQTGPGTMVRIVKLIDPR